MRTLEANSGGVFCVEYSPCGELLVSGSED